MFTKNLVLGSLLILGSTYAFAGDFYFGPGIDYRYTSAAGNSNYQNLSPRLTLGYGQSLSPNFSVAGEIFASGGSLQLSKDRGNNNVNAKINNSFGISVLPAVSINDLTKAYLRLGIVSSKFAGPDASSTGGQTGFGVQTNLSGDWDIRAEYVYSFYNSVSNMGSPKTNSVGVGLLRRFG